MIVTIHQPDHLPWLGFFHKIAQADVFVVLDNVQFSKNYFHNRNKIRIKSDLGWCWITVPVSFNLGDKLNTIKINDKTFRWKKKYWDSIHFAYCKAQFYEDYADKIKEIIFREHTLLSNMNMDLIFELMIFFGIKKKVILASEMNLKGTSTELLLDICRQLNARKYISGVSGRDYLDVRLFSNEGIGVEFQKFHHPVYEQIRKPFLPCMSAIDLLFNYGQNSLDVINGKGVVVMKEIFD